MLSFKASLVSTFKNHLLNLILLSEISNSNILFLWFLSKFHHKTFMKRKQELIINLSILVLSLTLLFPVTKIHSWKVNVCKRSSFQWAIKQKTLIFCFFSVCNLLKVSCFLFVHIKYSFFLLLVHFCCSYYVKW